MQEDFRNHDPLPTREEREWMSANPFAASVRVAVFVVVSVAVGGYASLWLEAAPEAPTLARVDK
jgi:hypothetical protein